MEFANSTDSASISSDDEVELTLQDKLRLTAMTLASFGLFFWGMAALLRIGYISEAERAEDQAKEFELIRQETVDETLVIRKVLQHADICKASSLKRQEADDCPICLDTFQIDEMVAWSADPNCNHVFHHACVKEWLIRKPHCPSCRTLLETRNCTDSCLYCIDHGIVHTSVDEEHMAGSNP